MGKEELLEYCYNNDDITKSEALEFVSEDFWDDIDFAGITINPSNTRGGEVCIPTGDVIHRITGKSIYFD